MYEIAVGRNSNIPIMEKRVNIPNIMEHSSNLDVVEMDFINDDFSSPRASAEVFILPALESDDCDNCFASPAFIVAGKLCSKNSL